jgi:hypothetical protein
MQYPKHLSAEQHFQRITYLGTLSIAQPAEQFATWLITGTAAILGLIVVNIDSVSNVISNSSLRWGLTLMTLSILCGVVTRQIGIAIQRGLAMLESLHEVMNSPTGEAIRASLTTPSDVLGKELASPFLPPFRGSILRGVERGMTDNLAAEKRFIKMFCIQLYASYAQAALGAIGLIWLVCGIR